MSVTGDTYKISLKYVFWGTVLKVLGTTLPICIGLAGALRWTVDA